MQKIVDLTNIFAPIILSGQLPVLPVCFASFRQVLQVKLVSSVPHHPQPTIITLWCESFQSILPLDTYSLDRYLLSANSGPGNGVGAERTFRVTSSFVSQGLSYFSE